MDKQPFEKLSLIKNGGLTMVYVYIKIYISIYIYIMVGQIIIPLTSQFVLESGHII